VGVLAYPDFSLRPNIPLGGPIEVLTPKAPAFEERLPVKAQTSVA